MMDHTSRRRLTTVHSLAFTVSYSVFEGKGFLFQHHVCASFLKLIYHRAGKVVPSSLSAKVHHGLGDLSLFQDPNFIELRFHENNFQPCLLLRPIK